jgi:AbrB family looped-hinge helix DNA binding protein
VLVKTVKVSEKGQITIPAEALRAIKAKKGTEFIFIQEGERLVLVKAESAGRKLIDDLGGWHALAAPVFNELWDNEADEIWDTV